MAEYQIDIGLKHCGGGNDWMITASQTVNGQQVAGGNVAANAGDTIKWKHAVDSHPQAFKIKFYSFGGNQCGIDEDCWPCSDNAPGGSAQLIVNKNSAETCVLKSGIDFVKYSVESGQSTTAYSTLDPAIVIREQSIITDVLSLGAALVVGILGTLTITRLLKSRSS